MAADADPSEAPGEPRPGCAGAVIDLAGRIGRLVLASPMPGRRLRVSPRVVKRAISKYNARGKVDRTTYKATIDIAILAAPLDSRRRAITTRPWN
jgi:hypothetical protein